MELIEAQQQYKDAREQLDAIILEMCPGQHRLVQHRDGGPPYCPACGRDQLGNNRRPPEDAGHVWHREFVGDDGRKGTDESGSWEPATP